MTITYDNTSFLSDMDDFSLNASTMLTRYISDEYIESTIDFTLIINVTLNETEIECVIENLDSMTAILFVNTSSKFNY